MINWKYILYVLLSVQLQAINILNITTPDTYGLSIPKDSIVIISDRAIDTMDTYVGERLVRHAVVYVCPTKECVQNIIDKYSYKYRTQGVSLTTW